MAKNKIKIFVDCHVFESGFQGTTTYLKGLYSEFILDRNFHFFLASNDIIQLQKIFGTHENVTYAEYRYSNKYLRLIFDIPLIIKKNKIDFAHFQYIAPPVKYCKYIVTIHDILFIDFPQYFPLIYRLKNRFLFRWTARHSDVVLSVSQFSKKQIEQHFRIENIVVTPNAVDPIYFESYDKESIKKEVLNKYGMDKYWIYISRWEPRKNHHSVLKVFVENQYYKDYFLVFVGNDAMENKEYNKYFEKLSNEIQSKVIRLKGIHFKELVKLLRGSNLSVYPSFAEGFGIPPLEAIAANVPSICSKTTAMLDFSFMEFMQFEPQNLDQLRQCINHNIDSKISEKVRMELLQKYNWKDSAQKLKESIENIL